MVQYLLMCLSHGIIGPHIVEQWLEVQPTVKPFLLGFALRQRYKIVFWYVLQFNMLIFTTTSVGNFRPLLRIQVIIIFLIKFRWKVIRDTLRLLNDGGLLFLFLLLRQVFFINHDKRLKLFFLRNLFSILLTTKRRTQRFLFHLPGWRRRSRSCLLQFPFLLQSQLIRLFVRGSLIWGATTIGDPTAARRTFLTTFIQKVIGLLLVNFA